MSDDSKILTEEEVELRIQRFAAGIAVGCLPAYELPAPRFRIRLPADYRRPDAAEAATTLPQENEAGLFLTRVNPKTIIHD